MSIHHKITDAIRGWDPLDGELNWPRERFDALVREVFAHQFGSVSAYRQFCERRGVRPSDDPSAEAIPAVPTDAFKHVRLFPEGVEPDRTFRTSGTTGDNRGAHHFRSLEVYREALHPPFRRFCNPEEEPFRFLVLAPPPDELPDSSLSFMLGELHERHGDAESGFFVALGAGGDWEIDVGGLEQALAEAEATGERVLLFGTAFAFAAFFDRSDREFRLPHGSRVVDTGGFKGRHGEVTRDELRAGFQRRLGVSEEFALSEYGMTELSSQMYTGELRQNTRGGRFYAPPWLRVEIVDPVELDPVDDTGVAGLLRFFDLANVDSVGAVQTSDRGRLHADGGLDLLGRAAGAQLRGCSLLVEDLLER